MKLLFFKLVLTPLLLLAASMATRRWGERAGGLLVGLPLTSGPISVFLALERGPAFAAQAASGSLAATAAQAAFCIAYGRLAAAGWPLALSVACAAFIAIAAALQWSGLPQTALFLIATAALVLALRLTPSRAGRTVGLVPPWWDLLARMALMASLVVGVTLVAPDVGPGPSGVLASFPFMAIILTLFAHRLAGHAAAQQVMRGMTTGLFAFAAFFYVLGFMLTRTNLAVAYGSAIACALGVQAVSLHRMRRPAGRTEP